MNPLDAFQQYLEAINTVSSKGSERNALRALHTNPSYWRALARQSILQGAPVGLPVSRPDPVELILNGWEPSSAEWSARQREWTEAVDTYVSALSCEEAKLLVARYTKQPLKFFTSDGWTAFASALTKE